MNCPLCGSEAVPVHFSRLDMVIRRCRGCGMMFQGPDSAAHGDRALIDEVYREYIGHPEQHLLLNTARLARLRELFGPLKGLKVLEIGAGNGTLGNLLLEAGADYTGLEPLALCRESSARLFPLLAPRIVPERFRPGMFPAASFDAVVSTDTFEHLDEPLSCAAALPALLRPGGKVYLEVPNEALLGLKGRLRVALGMYGRGYPTNPDHVSLFTRSSLKTFLRKAGLEPLAISQDSVWGSPSRIKLAFNGAPPLPILAASWFFYVTKLDLLLEQGTLAALARPAERP